MRIEVNGEARELAATSLDDALSELGLADAAVATALNGDFVHAGRRGETRLTEDDRLEILAPMAGG